ncbi:sigma-54-dependent transcriptional regulator [Desulfatirhabdium butyrativorans]|uniref:sigma-54-dependent transcriptional regulator n=1 Tax=Desulfatirhabdium butyrativorans TaxID=340467 RepID=UPI0004172E61|nr:sigma-54 dependent transcriptional regulator [Desulfatirhabdium butyrativorans]
MKEGWILIAEDETIARDNLHYVLLKDGYNVVSVENGQLAIEELRKREFALVMTDLKMQPVGGIEVLQAAKQLYPDIEVIVITGYATVQSAVQAMQSGAFSYLAKPYQIEEMRAQVRQAMEKRSLKAEVQSLRKQITESSQQLSLIGNSSEIEKLRQTIDQVAPTDCNILIFGETGTGKELVARTIHAKSLRADKRFVAINCGAFNEELLANELFGHEKDAFTGARNLKKGLIETASGGTLFLDEIGDMPLSMQVKLLRVLQERVLLRVGGTVEIPVDVRLIAATNKDLKQEAAQGRFRQDLFYRLNVISLFVPRLADRKDDILLLALHFLRRFSVAQGKNVAAIDDEVMEILLSYEFPGNVRELENFMERAVALAKDDTITVRELPEDIRTLTRNIRMPKRGFQTLEENEKTYIAWVLEQTEDNKTRAAEILGIDRVSLWRKLKRYGMA